MNRDQYLINQVKNNNDAAFTELLDLYRNLIFKVINSFHLVQGDYVIDSDNLFQEGSLILYNACFIYEPDKNVKFSTFVYKVLRSRISTYIRNNHAINNGGLISIDNVDNNDYRLSMQNLCVAEDPIAYHREKEFEEYLKEFVSGLPSIDQHIIKLRSDGYTYKEISKKLNVSTKKIDNRLRVLRKRLRKFLQRELL